MTVFPLMTHPLARFAVRLAIPAALAATVLEAPSVYGALTAEGRLSPPLKEQITDGSYAYSLTVELDFQPEYFHIRRLQQMGTVAGVQDHRIRVVQVRPDRVRAIAGFYWVKQVRPIGEE